MAKFRDYSPDQAYLLPPSVKDVLSADHLCFFVHALVEKLDLQELEQQYSEEGQPGYAPRLMLKVWLYAYALGITSSRRLEERIREDLAFRYLAGGATPDYWALNHFRRRHRRTVNDVFTQVLELARDLGMARLGHVAIDSSRVKANASIKRMDTMKRLRRERAKLRKQVRHWQQQCEQENPDEGSGTQLSREQAAEFERRLEEIPARLERLKKSGKKQVCRTDPDSRVLRKRGQSVVGYSAEVAVSEDHFIVAQRVTQNEADNDSLIPMVDEVQRQCREHPKQASADSGFFSLRNLEEMEKRNIDTYLPDSTLTWELNHGRRAPGPPAKHPLHRKMRRKLRTAEGRTVYERRKTLVEPVFGVLKEQRGMRQFRTRGLAAVAGEFSLAAIAYNMKRMYTLGLK